MWKTETVNEACRKFKGMTRSLKFIGGFHQNIYEFERDGEVCVLQLTPLAKKDREVVDAELKWVSFLRSAGISIPKQVLSTRGQSVENIIKLPIPCCVISFQKANGKPISPQDPGIWNGNLFRRWGQLMGKMHALSRSYQHHEQLPPYEEWDEGEIFHRDLSFFEPKIYEKFIYYLDQIRRLPQTERSYGLIHNDLRYRNMMLQSSGELTLLNFNHVKYHWYTYDIAIALFDALETVTDEHKNEFKERFLTHFMDGYQTEYSLEADWREQVELFLKYRLVFSYLYQVSFYVDQFDSNTKERLSGLREQLSV
ncbi:phosphotransferase enzyme family protein [Hazenella coriacea]|uniref:Ser/Thr protein kinase RdoA (MazF antagonist) n=1 Tax=Hazenella coriacea TaxID=1179467 RepID=A0A4R3L185_9BACL|nr:phosphotransferase [Hazenella coriacea]TCS93311.1 Ser/Thr protein kinase RdoA (MazF antagonist) [Hazenella coriacea]